MKMPSCFKVCVLLALLFFFNLSIIHAQNATLTKEETVNYINRKFKEIEGLVVIQGSSETTKIIKNCSVTLNGNKLTIRYGLYFQSDNSWMQDEEWTFNPMYLLDEGQSASYPKVNEQLNAIELWFSSSVALHKFDYASGFGTNNTRSTSLLSLYCIYDATFKQKIYKALLHLRDLIKAEDDAF